MRIDFIFRSLFGGARFQGAAIPLGIWLWLAPLPAAAQQFVPGADERTGWPGFSRVSIAFHGGFQYWTLSGLEDALLARHDSFAEDGFSLIDPTFDIGYSFGVGVQYRLTEAYFVRVAADWTRLAFDDRDRRTIAFLGGGDRTPVSFAYTTRVETRPVLVSLGLGRALHSRAVRWGFTANAVLAPLKVRDEFSLFIEEQFDSEVEATGFGVGFEGTISADYLTESNMTLFLETFFRVGTTDVDLETKAWESTVVPGTRGVDFGGGGLRLGFRFA